MRKLFTNQVRRPDHTKTIPWNELLPHLKHLAGITPKDEILLVECTEKGIIVKSAIKK